MRWLGFDGHGSTRFNVIEVNKGKAWSFGFIKLGDGSWEFEGLVYDFSGRADTLEEAQQMIEEHFKGP